MQTVFEREKWMKIFEIFVCLTDYGATFIYLWNSMMKIDFFFGIKIFFFVTTDEMKMFDTFCWEWIIE